MTMKLGQSTVIMNPSFYSSHSVIKKISNYIFRFQDKIGQGNFSKVYKGYHQITSTHINQQIIDEQVAIKIVQLSSLKSTKLQQLLFSQIEVIQSLNHPNILKCYQVFKSQNNCYIITQLCNGGDLQSVLKKYICLNQNQATPYIKDIFKGLLYLGERGIVHRDLKIANIFINNGVVKIADFGFAKYTQNRNFKDLDIGSPLYMSPQGMIDHIYGMKTDIWAFGVIIYQLLHGQTIFSNCKTQFDLKKAVSLPISFNLIRPDINPEIRQLIFKCLIINHEQRPDALSLANDQYLNRLLNSDRNLNHYSQKIINHSPSINQLYLQQKKNSQNQIKNYDQQYNNTNNYKYESKSFHQISNFQQNPQIKLNHIPQLNPQFYSHQNIQNSSHSPNRISNNQILLLKKQDNPLSKKVSFNQPKINIYNAQKNDSYEFYGSVKNDNRKPINTYNSLNNPDDFLSPHRINRNRPQIQVSPQQRLNSNSINNSKSDTASVLSFSHHNVNKKIQKNYTSHNLSSNIPKSISSNNLGIKINKNPINNSLTHSNHNNLYSSFHSNNSDSIKGSIKDNSLVQSVTVRKVLKHHATIQNQSNNNNNSNNSNNNKKFGQIIKGDKNKQLGPVKLLTKFQKNQDYLKIQLQKIKSKSNIAYDNQNQINIQKSQANSIEQQHSARFNNTQRQQPALIKQIPNFLQQKIKQNTYTQKKNLITTVIQFKQAVGILHYCRLIYKFITTLKKIKAFPHFRDLNFRSLQNPQTGDIFSRFLLTVLNQLILNIKFKQVIYQGQNYKKKQSQQEKLKQVTQEYFKKYYQETNKNRDAKKFIIPSNDKSTSIEWMKQFCQEIWQCLDNQSIIFKQRIQRGLQSNQNFIKNFQNICYLSLRIVQANQMLINSAKTKNYTSISAAIIQNWITQEYYRQSDYINAKNKYIATLNQTNPLKMSQTNDTEDNNGRLDFI